MAATFLAAQARAGPDACPSALLPVSAETKVDSARRIRPVLRALPVAV